MGKYTSTEDEAVDNFLDSIDVSVNEKGSCSILFAGNDKKTEFRACVKDAESTLFIKKKGVKGDEYEMFMEIVYLIVSGLCQRETEYNFRLIDKKQVEPEYTAAFEITPIQIH